MKQNRGESNDTEEKQIKKLKLNQINKNKR